MKDEDSNVWNTGAPKWRLEDKKAPEKGTRALNEAEKCMQRILSGENLTTVHGVTIDDLPAAAAANDADSFEIQSPSGGSQKLTFAQIKAALGSTTCTCRSIPNTDIDSLF